MDIKYLPLLISDIALSLYPQIIKLVPTTIEIQVAFRCITYSVLALIGYYITNNKTSKLSISTSTSISTSISTSTSTSTHTNINSLSFISTSIVMGLVNILHIISSYICFSALSSGVGYSIFYIYPIFNLLGRTLIYNEKIDIINYIYMLIALIGVYLNYRHDKNNKNNKDTEPTTQHIPDSNIEKFKNIDNFLNINNILNTKNTTIGIGAGIVSALTESIIYFMVKDNPISVSPFIQLIKTYILGGILSIFYLIKNININNTLDYHYWITLILFNAIIGFGGNLLRFIMIPKLSTLLFNSLIFIGVIFSYIWGYILSNEPITYSNLSGTLLILLSIFLINKK